MLARQRINFKVEEDIIRIRAEQERSKKAYRERKQAESQE